MCGISGVINLSEIPLADRDRSRVESMSGALRHRGPDDSGVVALDGACLGSCRLSIIDLSDAGHMPMSDSSKRWWITYNGEIYNFAQIRTELEALGHDFRSASDTEVVLHAWMEWGPDCLARLIGMFAFAVYDAVERRLALVRDRYGIKPLYFCMMEGQLWFGSEAKVLYPLLERRRVDQQRLFEWLLYRNSDALTSNTLLQGVECVLPGQIISVEVSGKVTRKLYYSTVSQVREESYESFALGPDSRVVEVLDDSLNQSIRDRLVSDVPVGTLCSGGLDSSLVTAIAARHSSDLTAFHVSIAEDPSLDEKKWVTELTKRLDVPLFSTSLEGAVFRSSLARVLHFSDWPLTHPNSVAYYLICQAAREQGVIVLQTGEGADELFGGYSWSYRRRRYLERLRPVMRLLPKGVVDRFAMMAYALVDLPVTSHRFREALPPTVLFADRAVRQDWLEECENAYAFVPNAVDRVVMAEMLSDLSDFLAPLLRRLDRMSMATSVESRVPFLDHRVVHDAINLPLRYRLRGNTDKWVLRQVARRYLPRRIATRGKMGFPLPLASWLAPLADISLFEDGFCERGLGLKRRGIAHFLRSSGEAPFAFFGLLTLELWGRLHIFGETIDTVEAAIRTVETRNAPG